MKTLKNALDAVSELRNLRREGRLAVDEYCKQVVMLCAPLVEEGFVDEATQLLRGLPVDYFAEAQLGQMLSDPLYCELAIDVAEAVNDSVRSDALVTMAAGDA